MARRKVSNKLWAALKPLIPVFTPSPKGGRRRTVAALDGILYVLHTGIPWEDLLQELRCGSGMTCWRRLRDWLRAGKGYDFARCRDYLRQRGITARIARRGVESKERLGRHRWVVERTHA